MQGTEAHIARSPEVGRAKPPSDGGMAPAPPAGLPRRDLIILPLLSVLTVLVLFVVSEVAARYFFFESTKDVCEVDDSHIGFRFRPNCSVRLKVAEGPWIVNQYNDCGLRTRQSCGPTPAGTTRLALLGSSASEGMHVAYDDTFAVRTERELTKACGRPVEIQNLGREACFPVCMSLRVDEALALKPTVVMTTVTPYDIEHVLPTDFENRNKPIVGREKDTTPEKAGALKKLQGLVTESRAVTAVEHFLFEDPATQLRMFLMYGDKANYLRPPFSAAWEKRLEVLDLLLGDMAQKVHAAHAAFVLIEIPGVAQAAAIALGNAAPPGVDPEALNHRLEQISAKHGIEFINVLDTFRKTPGSNRFFYLVDGHLNGEGQALISGPLVDGLVHGPAPVLSGCGTQETSSAGALF